MPAISASAPGKIILFGEHAVVYHRPAIAVPVTQCRAKTYLIATPQTKPGQVKIEAPDINLSSYLEDLPDDNPIKFAIKIVMQELNISTLPACILKTSSSIPIASGLGSGAAISISIIRALSSFLGHPFQDTIVSKLAFEVEKIHHGTPSGIDNTVITYNKPIFFIKEKPFKILSVQKPLLFVIGNSGITSPTSETVGDVRASFQQNPNLYNSLFDQIEEISLSAQKEIQHGNIPQLGSLMNKNHDILVEMNVSCPELDQLVTVAQKAGAIGAKLSGGGRGGNMIALSTEDKAEQISKALLHAGAVSTIITKVQSG